MGRLLAIRVSVFVAGLTLSLPVPAFESSFGADGDVNRTLADSYYVNVTGDTMTGTLLVPALTLSGDFTTTTGNMISTVADGGTAWEFTTDRLFASGFLFSVSEDGGASVFNVSHNGVVTALLTLVSIGLSKPTVLLPTPPPRMPARPPPRLRVRSASSTTPHSTATLMSWR